MKIHVDNKLKYFLVLISFCALVGLTLWVIIRYFNTDSGMEISEALKHNAQEIAVNLFFEKLTSIGEISLALIGVLWAFVVYKGSKIKIKTFHQKAIFAITNFFFLGSFLLYQKGYDLVLARLFFHNSIDLSAPIVSLWIEGQILFFVCGIICTVFTLLLCYRDEEEV